MRLDRGNRTLSCIRVSRRRRRLIVIPTVATIIVCGGKAQERC